MFWRRYVHFLNYKQMYILALVLASSILEITSSSSDMDDSLRHLSHGQSSSSYHAYCRVLFHSVISLPRGTRLMFTHEKALADMMSLIPHVHQLVYGYQLRVTRGYRSSKCLHKQLARLEQNGSRRGTTDDQPNDQVTFKVLFPGGTVTCEEGNTSEFATSDT